MRKMSFEFAIGWQTQASEDARRGRNEITAEDQRCALDMGEEHRAMWQSFAARDSQKARAYMGIREEDQFYA